MNKYLLAALAVVDIAAWSFDHKYGAYALIISILVFFIVGVFRSTADM